MSQQIITFLLNLLIAAAVILFSLSLSFIFSYIFFKFPVTSSEITSTLVTMFITGVVASLSISFKNMFNKETKVLPQYLFIGKIIAALVVVMIIIRYFSLTA